MDPLQSVEQPSSAPEQPPASPPVVEQPAVDPTTAPMTRAEFEAARQQLLQEQQARLDAHYRGVQSLVDSANARNDARQREIAEYSKRLDVFFQHPQVQERFGEDAVEVKRQMMLDAIAAAPPSPVAAPNAAPPRNPEFEVYAANLRQQAGIAADDPEMQLLDPYRYQTEAEYRMALDVARRSKAARQAPTTNPTNPPPVRPVQAAPPAPQTAATAPATFVDMGQRGAAPPPETIEDVYRQWRTAFQNGDMKRAAELKAKIDGW